MYPIGQIQQGISFCIVSGDPSNGYSFLMKSPSGAYFWNDVNGISILQASSFRFNILDVNSDGSLTVSINDSLWGTGVGINTDYNSLTSTISAAELTLVSDKEQFDDSLLSMSPYTMQYQGNTLYVNEGPSSLGGSLGNFTPLSNIYFMPNNYYRDCSGSGNNIQGINITGRRNTITDFLQGGDTKPGWTLPSQCLDGLGFNYCDTGNYCGTSNCYGPCSNSSNVCKPDSNNQFTCSMSVESKSAIVAIIILVVVIIIIFVLTLLALRHNKKSE